MRTQTFDFPLRQRHIADATGLTPVHVSKVLGELQRAGLIEINGRSLTILNGPELQRVADWQYCGPLTMCGYAFGGVACRKGPIAQVVSGPGCKAP